MQQENSYPRWIDYLPPIVKSLNSEVNDAVGGAPEVIGESELGEVLLVEKNTRKIQQNERAWNLIKKDYAVGDKVWVPKKALQRGFRRAYTSTMEDDMRTITKLTGEGRYAEMDNGKVYPIRVLEMAAKAVARAPRKRMRVKGPKERGEN